MNIVWAPPAGIAELAPESAAALADVVQVCWESLDPVDLELIRLRIAMIHGDSVGMSQRTAGVQLDEARIEALESWWVSDLFSERERALLAFVEQFVFSVSSMSDELVDALLRHDEPVRVHELSNAVWAFDLTTRLDLVAREVLP